MFETYLDYRYDPETKRHILLQDLVYVTKDGKRIVVPKGFTTDLDSVPRIPFVYSVAKGRAVPSAAVHDYLYYKYYNRKMCDDIFFEAMDSEEVESFHRYNIYYNIRAFGWIRFMTIQNSNKKRWSN
mgnify:CR=1 FL=1